MKTQDNLMRNQLRNNVYLPKESVSKQCQSVIAQKTRSVVRTVSEYITHPQSVSQNKVCLHMQGISMQVCLKCTLIVDNKLCWKDGEIYSP